MKDLDIMCLVGFRRRCDQKRVGKEEKNESRYFITERAGFVVSVWGLGGGDTKRDERVKNLIKIIPDLPF